MGQKDLAQSDYFNDKVRFADACNGILFQGKEIIRPEELQETDAEMVYREEEKRRKIIPDIVRMWKGIYIAILSVENQTKVDYKMIFRIMKAEAVNYERQWDEREKEYRRVGILHEKAKLCWVGKDEKFIPVITIVIYYGTDKKWDGVTCLYDMLDMDKELEPYISNYRMNLFDYHDCEDFSIFKTENRILFEMLSCSQDKTAMRKLLEEKRNQYKNVDGATIRTIFDIIGIKYSAKMRAKIEEEEDMCKAWDEMMEDERQAGREKGISLARTEDIRNIMDSLKVSALQAMSILKITETEKDKYISLLNR